MLFFDRYHLRETRSVQGSKWSERQALSNKRDKTEKKEKKKKKERGIKDRKNGWLTDATRLKLVM